MEIELNYPNRVSKAYFGRVELEPEASVFRLMGRSRASDLHCSINFKTIKVPNRTCFAFAYLEKVKLFHDFEKPF